MPENLTHRLAPVYVNFIYEDICHPQVMGRPSKGVREINQQFYDFQFCTLSRHVVVLS